MSDDRSSPVSGTTASGPDTARASLSKRLSGDGYESDVGSEDTDAAGTSAQWWAPVVEAPDLIDFASHIPTSTSSSTFAGDSPTDEDRDDEPEASYSASDSEDEASAFEDDYSTESEPAVADLISF